MNQEMEYLYHYTNIDSLAMILANRTIRFNNLRDLDDLQESDFEDGVHIGQYCFVGSWTESEEENIPMWRMYTNAKEGVRIRLRKYPFKTYQLEKLSSDPEWFRNSNLPSRCLFSKNDYLKGNYLSNSFCLEDILNKVIYDDKILSPRIISPELMRIDTSKMGKYKKKAWNFQNEWRYVITIFPISWSEYAKNGPRNEFEIIIEWLQKGKSLPFTDYYLEIAQDAFEDMEIVVSPNMSSGNRILTESIKEKYNPKAQIKNSSLEGKLR